MVGAAPLPIALGGALGLGSIGIQEDVSSDIVAKENANNFSSTASLLALGNVSATTSPNVDGTPKKKAPKRKAKTTPKVVHHSHIYICLLYTSDAADE